MLINFVTLFCKYTEDSYYYFNNNNSKISQTPFQEVSVLNMS